MGTFIKERPVGPKPNNPPPPQNPEAAKKWREETLEWERLSEEECRCIKNIFDSITGNESLEEISEKIEKILFYSKNFDIRITENEPWNEYWKKKGIDPKFMDEARRKFDKKEEESSAPCENHKTDKNIQDLDRLEKKIDDLGNEISDFANKIWEDLPVKGSVECHITKNPEKEYLAASFFPIVLTLLFATIGSGILLSFGVTSFWLRVAIMQIPLMFFYPFSRKTCGTISRKDLGELLWFLFGISLFIVLLFGFVVACYYVNFLVFLFFAVPFALFLRTSEKDHDYNKKDCWYHEYRKY